MRWSEFYEAVKTDLPVDKNRIGIATGNPNYLDQQITHCLTRLQELVPFYQGGHETVYGTEDLVINGMASVGRLPDGARPLDAYYKRTGTQCVSQPLSIYDWGNRFDLVCGSPRLVGGQFLIAMDPWAKEFMIYPSVYDEHQISLFWAGIRSKFDPDNETPFDDGVVEVVGLFVKAKIARLVDHDLSEHASYMQEYRLRQQLLYSDTRTRNRFVFNGYSPGQSNCANALTGCTTTPEVPAYEVTEFCAFGDSGEPSTIQNTFAVANLVRSLDPDFVMHLGDTNYPDGVPSQFQEVLIKPYGVYIPQSFYLAYGNHDIITDHGAFLYNLLTAQKSLNGVKTYFSFIPKGGFCQCFVLDTNGDPVEQAAWLEDALSKSCMWNLVFMHKSPYTSEVNYAPGNTAWRFPFKDWGAHVVISAHSHNYERLWVDDFQYVVCGLGGAPKRGFVNPPTPGSQFRYDAFYGSLFITAIKTRLQITFYDTRGESVDSIEFTGTGDCPSVLPDNLGWCSLRGEIVPEGAVVANPGCTYRRNNGTDYEFWYKESGVESPFGWIMRKKLV